MISIPKERSRRWALWQYEICRQGATHWTGSRRAGACPTAEFFVLPSLHPWTARLLRTWSTPCLWSPLARKTSWLAEAAALQKKQWRVALAFRAMSQYIQEIWKNFDLSNMDCRVFTSDLNKSSAYHHFVEWLCLALYLWFSGILRNAPDIRQTNWSAKNVSEATRISSIAAWAT